jgi:hypothetical protein
VVWDGADDTILPTCRLAVVWVGADDGTDDGADATISSTLLFVRFRGDISSVGVVRSTTLEFVSLSFILVDAHALLALHAAATDKKFSNAHQVQMSRKILDWCDVDLDLNVDLDADEDRGHPCLKSRF